MLFLIFFYQFSEFPFIKIIDYFWIKKCAMLGFFSFQNSPCHIAKQAYLNISQDFLSITCYMYDGNDISQ